MKENLRLIGVYLTSLILATLMFFCLLWSPILKENNNLFFRAGSFMLTSTIILFLALVYFKSKTHRLDKLTLRDIFIICLLFFFINWNVYGMIPFNTSRSNSIIILGYLYKNHGLPKTKEEIKSHTQAKYFDEYDSVGVRLREQESTGNISQKNGKYIITQRGIFIADMFMKITDLYNIKNNYLSGEQN